MKYTLLLPLLFFTLFLNAQVTVKPGKERITDLLNKLNDGGKSPYVMIVSHRGDWRNAPENSLEAYQNSIDKGIDSIEIDVRATKDAQLAIIHDLTLERTTNGKGNVKDHTLEELSSLKLKSGIGTLTTHQLPTLAQTLGFLKGKALIFVDKWRTDPAKILEEAKKQDCLNQIVVWERIKTIEAFNEKYDPAFAAITYIPLIVLDINDTAETFENLLDALPANIKLIGIGFEKDNLPVISQLSGIIRKKGVRAMVFSSDPKINAGHNDDLAVKEIDKSYKWMLDLGINVFFTDRPFLLDDYLKNKGRRNP